MADIIKFPLHLVDGKYRSPEAVRREIERENRRAARAIDELAQANFNFWLSSLMSDLIDRGRSERRCDERMKYDAVQLAMLERWGK